MSDVSDICGIQCLTYLISIVYNSTSSERIKTGLLTR